jgi:hypothetical protein
MEIVEGEISPYKTLAGGFKELFNFVSQRSLS